MPDARAREPMAASSADGGRDDAERPPGVATARPAFTALSATGLSPYIGCAGGLNAAGWGGGGRVASSRHASTYAAAARRLRASSSAPASRSTPPAVARGAATMSFTTVEARWPMSPATTRSGLRRWGVSAAGMAPRGCGVCGGSGASGDCCGVNAAAPTRAVVVMANVRMLETVSGFEFARTGCS